MGKKNGNFCSLWRGLESPFRPAQIQLEKLWSSVALICVLWAKVVHQVWNSEGDSTRRRLVGASGSINRGVIEIGHGAVGEGTLVSEGIAGVASGDLASWWSWTEASMARQNSGISKVPKTNSEI